MALDHYVSQVHLKNFYAPELGERMYAIKKTDLKRYPCDAYSQCRIEGGSNNPYLQEPRVIEEFLRDVEPRYNAALVKLRDGRLDPEAVFAIAGFAAFVQGCSPGGMRIHSRPPQEIVATTTAMLEASGMLPPPPPVFGGKTLAQLLDGKDVIVNVDPKYPQSMGITNILRSTSLWGNSCWDIIINDDPSSPFFTSDYPLAIEPSGRAGIVNRILPLAPDLAIRILPDLDQKGRVDLSFTNLRVRKVNARRKDTAEINRRIVQCAETVVYFSRDLPWIPAFVEKHRQYRIEPHILRIPQGDGHMILSTLRIAENRVPAP
jgi:hypothetical protein